MKTAIKLAIRWCVAGVLTLYIAFVFQMLWNWFALPVFHADISYWNAVGLLMITSIINLRNSEIEVALAVVQIKIMAEASIPEEKRAETMRLIDESGIKENGRYSYMITGMKALGGTVLLAIGFGIHTFLM